MWLLRMSPRCAWWSTSTPKPAHPPLCVMWLSVSSKPRPPCTFSTAVLNVQGGRGFELTDGGMGGFGQTVNVKGEEEAHGVRSVAEKRPARLVVLKVAS